jgi:hypothetical protein
MESFGKRGGWLAGWSWHWGVNGKERKRGDQDNYHIIIIIHPALLNYLLAPLSKPTTYYLGLGLW